MSSIKWDEETIAEHDKLRGTRMKINEPNTPYEHSVKEVDYDDDDDLNTKETESHKKPPHAKDEVVNNWEALNAQLTYEAMQQQEQDSLKLHEVSIGEYRGNEQDNNIEHNQDVSSDELKKKKFAEKRAAHYNEYLVLKAMRQKQVEEDDDDDDDEDN